MWEPRIERLYDKNGILISQTIQYNPQGKKWPYPHEPNEKPVAWQNIDIQDEIFSAKEWENIDPIWDFMYRPLYTHPFHRTWIGLTNEEQQQLYDQWQSIDGWGVFYDSIEAALKEKNHV